MEERGKGNRESLRYYKNINSQKKTTNVIPMHSGKNDGDRTGQIHRQACKFTKYSSTELGPAGPIWREPGRHKRTTWTGHE